MTQPTFVPADHPRGADGQFSAKRQGESTPLSMSMWNNTGTFEYPPVPKTVEELITFWQDVEISDAVCEQARVAYLKILEVDANYEAKRFEYQNPPPHPESKNYPGWKAARDAAAEKAVEGKSPEIPVWHTRAVIRAIKIYWHAHHLPPGPNRDADIRRVHSMRVELPGGQVVSIAGIAKAFEADRLNKFLIDPTRQNLAETAKSTAEMAHRL